MKELVKTKDDIFNEYYVGIADNGKKVICILDTNCVRYMVFNSNGKRVSRRYFNNAQREICFANATKALNK